MPFKPLTEQETQDVYDRAHKCARERHPNYVMGCLVGENLLLRYAQITKGIEKYERLSLEERHKLNSLYEAWKTASPSRKESEESRIAWDTYRAYRNQLEDKYIPDTMECVVNYTYIEDMDQFKKGIGVALWHSDLSEYSALPEHIKIESDSLMGHSITLTRHHE